MKNYTKLLFIAVVLLTGTVVSAQKHAGIKAGANYSGLSGYSGGKSINAHAGLFAQWDIDKNWFARPELLWSSGKQRYSVADVESTSTQSLITHFVSLPVIIRYKASSKVFIDAGPQFSFLVSAKDVTSGGAKADVKRSLRSTDIAFSAGAGYLITKKAEFYLRYSHGLTDLTLYDNNKDATRLWQAGIAFSFK